MLSPVSSVTEFEGFGNHWRNRNVLLCHRSGRSFPELLVIVVKDGIVTVISIIKCGSLNQVFTQAFDVYAPVTEIFARPSSSPMSLN